MPRKAKQLYYYVVLLEDREALFNLRVGVLNVHPLTIDPKLHGHPIFFSEISKELYDGAIPLEVRSV
jgi:hypothetical protein